MIIFKSKTLPTELKIIFWYDKKMSAKSCEPDKHEYRPSYIECCNCESGYIICNNCDGDGNCLDVCDKGLMMCAKKGCKYGLIYKSHYCIKCSKTRYVK